MTVCIHLIPLSQPCNSCGPLRERSNTFGHIPDEIQTLRSVVRALEAEVARLKRIEAAAKDALRYLDEVGDPMLDAGMEDSGCDAITTALRAAIEGSKP